MAIPDYQTIMLPLLKFFQDGKEHTTKESIDHLANEFKLSVEERHQLLPSGNDEMFRNKVRWARLYIFKAGLLESTKQEKYRISKIGLDVLKQNPNRIDIRFLTQFPKYQEWKKTPIKDKLPNILQDDNDEKLTPEEGLAYHSRRIQENLATDILNQLQNISDDFFEKLVIDLLIKMGYGGSKEEAGEVLGRSGDGGIDGVINEDTLGLDVIYVQAKRWNTPVGSKEIRDFIGSLEIKHSNKGVFFTTSKFSEDGLKYIEKIGKKVILIDGEKLVNLMIKYQLGVNEIDSIKILKIDKDYFLEE